MAFHDRSYQVYVILGDPSSPPVWQWSRWEFVADLLGPLVTSQRGRAAVRCSQLAPGRDRPLAFGRLSWAEASHQRWTHQSPITGSESADWLFEGMEAWAPSWTVCEREGLAPDFFLSVVNEAAGAGWQEQLAFNPLVVIAMADSEGQPRLDQLREAVVNLSDFLGSRLTVHQERDWGVATGGGGFANAIQDLDSTGLFKPGPRHRRPVDLGTLAEEWRLLAAERVGA